MDAEAMDVLLTNMCSLERAVPICKTSVRFVADLSHISGKFPKFRQNVSRAENYDVCDLRRKHNSQTCGTMSDNLVEFEKVCKMSLQLETSASILFHFSSIQPRTSRGKV